MEFVKDYCSSDAHPDMAVAGFWGRLVFREFVRICGQFDTRGRVPRKFANPVYLVKRMELTEAGVPDADVRVGEGVSAAVEAGLLVPEGEDLRIPGWDRFYESHADRQKSYRDRKRVEDETLRARAESANSGPNQGGVTSRSVTVTNSDTNTRRDETRRDATSSATASPRTGEGAPLLGLEVVPAAKPKPEKKAATPAAQEKRAAWERLFEQERGEPYRWAGAADQLAANALAPVAVSIFEAKVLRGLRGAGFQRCSTLAQIKAKWNDLAGPAPPGLGMKPPVTHPASPPQKFTKGGPVAI